MKISTAILFTFPVLLMLQVNLFGQTPAQIGQKDKFVDAVNTGQDSALYLGKQLIKALENETTKNPLLPRVYLSMGNFYNDRDRLPEAINYYQKTLDAAEVLKDSLFIAYANGSIGNVYVKTNRWEDALPVFRKNLEIWMQKGKYELVPVAQANISKCLIGLKNYDKAISILQEGLAFCEENKIVEGKSKLAYYLASIYQLKGNQKLSLQWVEKSKNYLQSTEDEQYLQTTLLLASIKKSLLNYKTTDSLCLTVYNKLKYKNKYRQLFIESCECLVSSKTALGEDVEALKYQWEYTTQKDALATLFQVNQLGQIELEHTLHKNLLLDSLSRLNNEKELKLKQQLEKDKHQIFNWLWILFCALIMATAFYLYKSYKKQKQTFGQLAAVNKEITDSINYAKHIQDAFLPNADELKKSFNHSFLLYQPKDVVAGDFYWFDEQDDKILLAAAGCTGHGVPGAMVSVICHGALHDAVRKLGLLDTGAILDATRKTVANRFKQEKEIMNDGMDISLCIIDKNTLNMQFSGAKNPLWIVRDRELTELKGNQQSIAYSEILTPFTTHQFQLKQKDSVYLFSDDYSNQFVVEKGKKFKASTFRELLLNIQDNSMEEQKLIIDEAFETWKGQLEQIDDVCVIGVKI